MKVSRVTVVGATAALAVLGLSAPAFAHVTVASQGAAAKGGNAVLDFKVPNERDNATTTKVEVNFPYQQHPLTTVSPQDVPGWTIKITKSKLPKPVKSSDGTIDEAVSKVTWTADGEGIKARFFQEFPVSVGKLPEDADALTFKAVQWYSGGETIRWIDQQQKGQPEPEHPAPVLQLTTAPAENGQSGAQAAKDDTNGAARTGTQASGGSGDSDTIARVLGVIGIIVGLLGFGYGALAGSRRTR